MSSAAPKAKRGAQGDDGSVRRRKRVASLKHPPENWELYARPDDDDQSILDLAADLKFRGQQDDMIITADGYVVSGNRRLISHRLNGQQFASCRVLRVRWADLSRDERFDLLRRNNLQRHKSVAEQVRETLIDADPEQAAANLRRRRDWSNSYRRVDVSAPLTIEGSSRRWGISNQKSEHRAHIRRVVFEERRAYWPLGPRAIHYPLLNHSFYRNTKQKLPYVNDPASYAATCDLVMRMLLCGELPWDAVDDSTRPVSEHLAFSDVTAFIQQETERLFCGYWRNLLQTQPHYVVVVVEKNTVFNMAKTVTDRYQLPTMSGRGFCSIAPWKRLYDRYVASGKQRLILLVLSDHDPEGSLIPHVAGRVLRDDFGVADVEVIKAGVTRQQIEKYALPVQNFAKEKSSNRKWFIERNDGDESVYELESLNPADMLADLESVVRNVLDMQLFNLEVEREEAEQDHLKEAQTEAVKAVKALKR